MTDMFGKKAARIAELEAQVRELKDEIEPARPYLPDARAIGAQVAELVGREGSINYTTSQVARIAYQSVLTERQQEVQDQMVADYRAEHEAALLQQLVEDTRQNEGEQIAADVALMVQTDGKLAQRLKQEAREAVWREAESRIAGTFQQKAAEALAGEEQRRIYFEEVNAQFRFDDEIDLGAPHLLQQLRHGDKLHMTLRTHGNRDEDMATVWCEWHKLSPDEQGWLMMGIESSYVVSVSQAYTDHGRIWSMPHYKTSVFGIRKDVYSNVFTPNIIRPGMVLGIGDGQSSLICSIGSGGGGVATAIIHDLKITAKDIDL